MELKDLHEAVKSGVTVVDFYATWCNPCKMLAMQLREVEEAGVKVIKIDGEQFPFTRDNFGVMSYPTMFFFKDGVIVDRHNGYLPAEAILAKVNSL